MLKFGVGVHPIFANSPLRNEPRLEYWHFNIDREIGEYSTLLFSGILPTIKRKIESLE